MGLTKDQLVIFAARSGNLALLRQRVSAGGNVNHLDPVHGAPLLAAIRAVKLPAVEWLIENGADVNTEYGDGVGPLEIALHSPVPEIVGVLLRAGARLRRKTRRYYAERLTKCLNLLAAASEPERPNVAGELSPSDSRADRDHHRALAHSQWQRTRTAKTRRRGPRR